MQDITPSPKRKTPAPRQAVKPKRKRQTTILNTLKKMPMSTRSINKKIYSSFRSASKRRRLVLIGVIVIIAASSLYLIKSSSKLPEGVAPTPRLKDTQGELAKGTPGFKTMLPRGKTIDEYSGWTRVSPPERNPVFAYVDKIEKTPVRISQQPLPKDFEADTDASVEQLAIGYSANKIIKVGSTTVYIGTSAKGPQSVIFTKNNLLILMYASAKISDKSWSKYISSLE